MDFYDLDFDLLPDLAFELDLDDELELLPEDDLLRELLL